MMDHRLCRLMIHQRPHLVFALRGALSVLAPGDVSKVLEEAAAALYEISEPASVPVPRDKSGMPVTPSECWKGGTLQCPI